MLKYILKRLIMSVFILLGVSFILFVLIQIRREYTAINFDSREVYGFVCPFRIVETNISWFDSEVL